MRSKLAALALVGCFGAVLFSSRIFPITTVAVLWILFGVCCAYIGYLLFRNP